MKNMIFREFDTTLIVTVNHSGIHLLNKKPTRIFLIHMASHAAWLETMYSVSAELSAFDLYFLLYQETTADPILRIPPDVLFVLDGLPA